MQKLIKRGFTLIELLVTIGILAIVMAAVLAAVNPIDKINAANDSKVQSDIGQLATALNAYATSHNGAFPCKAVAAGCPNVVAADGAGLTALVNSGEMQNLPVLPTGYTGLATYEAGYYANAVAASPTQFKLLAEQKATRNLATSVLSSRWMFCSWTGGTAYALTTATANTQLNATACPAAP